MTVRGSGRWPGIQTSSCSSSSPTGVGAVLRWSRCAMAVRPVSRRQVDAQHRPAIEWLDRQPRTDLRVRTRADALRELLQGTLAEVGSDHPPVVAHPHDDGPAPEGLHRGHRLDDALAVRQRRLELDLFGLVVARQGGKVAWGHASAGSIARGCAPALGYST